MTRFEFFNVLIFSRILCIVVSNWVTYLLVPVAKKSMLVDSRNKKSFSDFRNSKVLIKMFLNCTFTLSFSEIDRCTLIEKRPTVNNSTTNVDAKKISLVLIVILLVFIFVFFRFCFYGT